MDRIAGIITRHCRILSLLALLGAVIPACYLPYATIDNSIEVWLDRDSASFARYRDFLDRYGSDEFIIIGVESPAPLSNESLDLQRRMAQKLETIEGVARVVSLADYHDALQDAPFHLTDEGFGNSLVRGLFLGADGKSAGILVWLTEREGPVARRRTVKAIQAAAADFQNVGLVPHLAGTPLMNVELDRASTRASATFLPIAVLVSVAVLFFALRGLEGVLASMCAVAVTVVWTVGIMTWTGRSMNMVTVILPSLLFVLALSSSIHIASRFAVHAAHGATCEVALLATLRELIRPILLTSVTTSIGFGSLCISDMRPVADLRRFAAVGMLISLVANLLVVPGVLSWCYRGSVNPSRVGAFHWLGRVGAATAHRASMVVFLSTLVLLGCIAGAAGIGVESNVLKFFPDESHVAQDYHFIASKLTGLYTVELEIHSNRVHEDDMLTALQRLGDAIATRPEVARVDHYSAFRPLGDILPGGNGVQGMARALEFVDGLSAHYRHTQGDDVGFRLSALVTAMASSDFYTLLDFVRERADELLPASATWHVTGIVSLLNDVQRSLVRTQIRSFGIAALAIILVIGVLFRSLRAALASVLPNMLPVFGTLAMMAAVGVPLDAATVMIASIAIGIAADDTIHFLVRYRDDKASGHTAPEATASTLRKIGGPIAFTSIVVAGGFSVLALAEFRPIRDFGLLTGFTMLTALACDVLILPACARLFKLWEIR